MLRTTLLLAGLGSAAALTTAELSTDYTAERVLVLDTTMSLSMEVVESSMTRNGEPLEGRGGGGGGSSEERRLVIRERVLEHADGAPTKVRRAFEKAEGETMRTFGEQEMENSLDSPFDGVVIELTDDEGDISIEVVEGDDPDEEHLAGQGLTLTLDALLPDDDVSTGDTWSLDSEAITHALMLDIQPHLFPPQAREESDGERGGGGGGRRRGRGGRSGSALSLLINADYAGEAELVATDEEGDDGPVARLRFEVEAEGEVENQGGGGGGGRGGGGEGETTYTVQLEGELVFSLSTRRPISLEVEGTVGRISDRTFDRGETTMSIYSEEAGTFEMTIEVSEKAIDEDDD